MLSTMNDLGKFLLKIIGKASNQASFLFHKTRAIGGKIRGKFSKRPEPEPASTHDGKEKEAYENVEEPKNPIPESSLEKDDDDDPPVIAAVITTVGWLFLCAGLFCIWETNWSYFTSFYFFFIRYTRMPIILSYFLQ